MTSPTEQLGAAQFEKLQGVHQVTATEVPPISRGPVRITERRTPFTFEILPTLPEEQEFVNKVAQRAVYCYPTVIIETPTARWVSKTRLPILVAHGGRRSDNMHIIQSDTRLLNSESAMQSLTEWCKQNSLPEPTMFMSCDERISPVTFRWDQHSKTDILGFAGGLNFYKIEDANNKFILPKEMYDSALTQGNIIGPFSSPTHNKRGIAYRLFNLEMTNQTR